MTVPTPGRPTAGRLEVADLQVRLGGRSIVDGVSFELHPGSIAGLVGESGSGKSTIAKAIVGIHPVHAGRIEFDGIDVAAMRRGARRRHTRRVQLIPQDPYSSLDPLRTIGQTLAEAIDPGRPRPSAHASRIGAVLESVSLPPDVAARYPHEFSGGQRQRVAIARALAAEPEIIIADEITSALDVSTQAGVLDLIRRLRAEMGLTMLFISHNLAVVEQLCDDVIVLLRGSLVEYGPAERVFAAPQHEYTASLLAAVPGSPGFSLEPEPIASEPGTRITR